MAKRFTETEKKEIHQKIMTVAHKEFQERGFQRTSVAELAELAGIATGTFYHFFDSKELLFFRLLEDFEEFKISQVENSFQNGHPIEELEEYLLTILDYVLNDSLFQWYYSERVFEKLLKKVPAEELEQHMSSDLRVAQEIIEYAQESNCLTKISAKELVSHMAVLYMTCIYKKELNISDQHSFMKQQVKLLVLGLQYL